MFIIIIIIALEPPKRTKKHMSFFSPKPLNN